MRYTILSFNFNGYDLIRTPRRVDPDATYLMVTDKMFDNPVWKPVIDKKLVGKDPIYSSYYVRYHPVEYVDTDIVVVMDASIQINDYLNPIIDKFLKSGSYYLTMLSTYDTDEQKIEIFNKDMHRVTDTEADEMRYFNARMGQTGWRGFIMCAFAVFVKSPKIEKMLKHTWRYIMAMGHDGKPARMDEVILHKVLYYYSGIIKPYVTSVQLVQSTYMTYCKHGKDEPVRLYQQYDQRFALFNQPVRPHRFSKAVDYPEDFLYRTEAMLLTKHLNPADLKEWLNWHIFKCGFEHIHIFDNESPYDVRKVCNEYGDKVTYELVDGHPRQYRLYDTYINYRSRAEWIMPIDDDEYLDLGEFKNISDAISYYEGKIPQLGMLAIRWKHLFPKDLKKERTGSVLEYCTEENPELAKKFMRLGDRTIKTLVRHTGPVHYEETWETTSGGHIPKNKCCIYAQTCDGKPVFGCGVSENNLPIHDERIRLLHCRYKGPSDWKKNHGPGTMTVSDAIPHERQYTNIRFE